MQSNKRKAYHLASLCAEAASLRGANGQILRGALSQILSLNKGVYNWLTIGILKKSLKKRKYSKDKPREPINDTTIISDLTEESYSEQSNEGLIYPLQQSLALMRFKILPKLSPKEAAIPKVQQL
jgi:hypothetical protein